MSVVTPRRKALIWVKALVSLGLLTWLAVRMFRRDGVQVLFDRVTSLDPAWLLVAVGLHFVAVLSGVLRWRTLLDAAGLRFGFGRLLRSFLVGRFYGAFTPSTTGLDGWRLYDIGTESGEMPRSGAVIVVEKLVGLIGMALVCAGLVPLGGIELMGPLAPIAAAAMAVGAFLGLWLMSKPGWLEWCFSRVPGERVAALGQRIVDALGRARLDGSTTAKAIALGVVSHLALSSVFFATALAVGVDQGAWTMLVAGNAITLAVLFPISIGGVGVREGVAVVLLAAVGVGSTDATLLALLGYLTGQVPALLGGLLTLRSRDRGSRDSGSRDSGSRDSGSAQTSQTAAPAG